ncbi:MAG: aminotransferase class V-fold PLP-dependent enzyme [Polyangiaceae bacterium]
MSFDVELARSALPSTQQNAYFNAGTFGPLPRAAHEAMVAHSESSLLRGRIGHDALHAWLDEMDEVRAAFGASLGVPSTELALNHCTTDGVNTVLWGLRWKAGDEVLTTTQEHPGLTAPLEEVARVWGVTVRAVDPKSLAESIRPETRLVAVSHVLWTNGDVLPLADIAAAARKSGVPVLVDGAQSTGAIPVDLHATGVDFYTVSGQKWFCGPSGTGALWVHPRALASLGTPWPWYLSKDRFAQPMAEWTTTRRLDASTLSMTSLAGIRAALLWHKTQVEAGALDAAMEKAILLRANLAALPNVRVVSVERASTIVSFTLEGVAASIAATRLEDAGVLVRSIPGTEYVRASVGFWNDEHDIERLVQVVQALSTS